MYVSAVVLTFNSQRYVEKCLRSLVEVLESLSEPSELIVIENGSSDETPSIVRRLAEEFPSLVRVTYLEENAGTTVTRNMGAGLAEGRYLLFCDSDVEHRPGTLEGLLAHLDATPDCGIAVPRLNYPGGRHQISTDVFPTFWVKARRVLKLKSMEQNYSEDNLPPGPVDVDYAISAYWLLPRHAYDQTGPLDEKIFFAPEDVDYCIRVWAAGLRVMYVPGVLAIHDAQETTRKSLFSRDVLDHLKGLAYLFRKHRYVLGHKRLYRRIGRHR